VDRTLATVVLTLAKKYRTMKSLKSTGDFVSNHIQYAIHLDEKIVVSRLHSEIAWPILDYDGIGRGGDYMGPLHFELEKMLVHSIGREWDRLIWTRYVPTHIKNVHRAFWKFKPLRIEIPPRCIAELCLRHKTRFFYHKPNGWVGVYHGTWGSNVGLYHWFELSGGGYRSIDVSDGQDDYHRDAVKKEVKRTSRLLVQSKPV
jgi:hypothetical protein